MGIEEKRSEESKRMETKVYKRRMNMKVISKWGKIMEFRRKVNN